MKSTWAILCALLFAQSIQANEWPDFLWKRKAWQCQIEVTVLDVPVDGPVKMHDPIQASTHEKEYFHQRHDAVHNVYQKLYKKTNDWRICQEGKAFEHYGMSERNRNMGYWFKVGEDKIREMFFPKPRYPKVIEKIKTDPDMEAGSYHVCKYECFPSYVDPQDNRISYRE